MLVMVAVVAGAAGIDCTYADSWLLASQRDYVSENGDFSAQVIPAAEKRKPKLRVFGIEGTSKRPLWQCELKNKVAPVEVFTSDDGKYVVANDEWGGIGYGEFVVAFYGSSGLIKNYSMEEVLHLPEDITSEELWRLVPHTISSRHWYKDSIKFLYRWSGNSYFCVWLGLFERWAVWNMANGDEVGGNNQLIEKLNRKARRWALQRITERPYDETAYRFLGYLKDPNDRPVIEELLSAREFGFKILPPKVGKKPDVAAGRWLKHITCFAPKRLLAERILAEWDSRAVEDRQPSDQLYHYLGKVCGVVKLPEVPGRGKAKSNKFEESTFCIYLIPVTDGRIKADTSSWFQKLAIGFDRYTYKNYKLTEHFAFSIEGVTPGQYRLKAVLGKAKPFNFYAGRVPSPAQEGDFESLESHTITVRPGHIVEDIVIDCTKQVVKRTD
jgi:hypothetical protein